MAHAWQNSDYAQRIEITIPSPDGNLTAFPFPIILDGLGITDTDIVQDDWCVYDDNDNLLDWERETYAEAGGTCTGVIWSVVNQYAAPAGEQNTVWFYFDRDAGATPGNTPADVWDANFKVVLHLDEAAGAAVDSSGSGNNGSYEGSLPDPVAGAIGTGQDLDGTDDYIEVAHSADFAVTPFTFEYWFNPDSTNADGRSQHYDQATKDGFMLWQDDSSGGLWRFHVYVNGAVVACDSDAAPSGAMQHIAGVRDASGNCTLYVDGVAQADTETLGGAIDSSAPLLLGTSQAFTNDMSGVMDEARFSVTNRSTAWIKQEYTVINTGLTYEAIEGRPAVGHPTMRRWGGVPYMMPGPTLGGRSW